MPWPSPWTSGRAPASTTYRATITRTGGGKVFGKAGLKPNALEALMITFPATFFPPATTACASKG